MTPERTRQALRLVEATLDRPSRDRRAFLDAACGEDIGDPPLRRKVEELLELDAKDPGFMAKPLFSVHGSAAGRRIGPYNLVRYLGHGGMGVVYLAERRDPASRVALKLARRGDAETIRRFHHERRVLARFDHPNVARLLDWEAAAGTLPYLVMEYVAGQPIDRYCRIRRLSFDARLELFGKLCSAVEEVHRRRVVHCDLKPDNILVTRCGEPKLLDFGVARFFGAGESAAPEPMTPRYASPEQLQGRRVTPASDIYSLGVVLCELLTGLHPHPLVTGWSEERIEATCEREPVLSRRLTGGLGEVVLKALRKDPRERHESCTVLADEIHRMWSPSEPAIHQPKERELS